jgi:hypothetical protein
METKRSIEEILEDIAESLQHLVKLKELELGYD